MGLLPQCNTFATYLLEVTDIHIFGGNCEYSNKKTDLCFIAYRLLKELVMKFGHDCRLIELSQNE